MINFLIILAFLLTSEVICAIVEVPSLNDNIGFAFGMFATLTLLYKEIKSAQSEDKK